MSIVCSPAGGLTMRFPCCSVCASFLVGDYPVLSEDLDHAIHLSHCLEDLESVWGDMVSFEVVSSVTVLSILHAKCTLCKEEYPSVVAVVDFKGGAQ